MCVEYLSLIYCKENTQEIPKVINFSCSFVSPTHLEVKLLFICAADAFLHFCYHPGLIGIQTPVESPLKNELVSGQRGKQSLTPQDLSTLTAATLVGVTIQSQVTVKPPGCIQSLGIFFCIFGELWEVVHKYGFPVAHT